jgi:hypothetical protein
MQGEQRDEDEEEEEEEEEEDDEDVPRIEEEGAYLDALGTRAAASAAPSGQSA